MPHIKFVNEGGRRMPEEISHLVKALKSFDGVESVGCKEFLPKSHQKRPPIEFRGYDERSRTIKMRVNREGYNQVILIRASAAYVIAIKEFAERYFSS